MTVSSATIRHRGLPSGSNGRSGKRECVVWHGVACSRLERYDEAIEAYHQAVTLDPKYASAWFGIGVAYLLSGNETEPIAAVQELGVWISHRPTSFST